MQLCFYDSIVLQPSITFICYVVPMSNELIFIISMVIDLSLILLLVRFGKDWIKILIVINLIMVQVAAVKNVELFGFVANASAVFYAAIFLATDMLTEHR